MSRTVPANYGQHTRKFLHGTYASSAR